MGLRQHAALLAAYLGPQRRPVALLALLLLAGAGLELANPLILRRFIDSTAAGGALSTLTWLALSFLVLALGTQAIALAETYLASSVGLAATNRLRADLTRHCLNLDPLFHNTHTPGELIERVDGDVTRLGSFFSRLVVQLIGSGVLMIGILILLFRVDWRIGLSLSGLAGAALLVITRMRGLAVPHWERARQASADLYGFIEERLSGTEDIRANGATAYVMRRLFERARELFRRGLLASVLGSATGSMSIVLFALSSALGLGLGAYLFQQGEISIGTVYLVFTYTTLLSRPIEQITRQMQELQQAGASLARIQDLLSIRSSLVAPGQTRLPDGPLPVVFENVSFGYADGTAHTLRGISFALPAGGVLGLLGRTGSGKTTLTRLLFRLYDPTQGEIRLGGVDLRDAPLEDVRQKVGLVTQDIQLFNASVRDNLTFFDRHVSDEQVKKVIAELGLWDWYHALPRGLDTILSPGGQGLSAGQAQLLAFARVFLKSPGVVVLDEASSRLDPATEQRLERAVDRLLEGRTVLVIAHRLATVHRADAIMILEGGEIVEAGPRSELERDVRSRFFHLLQTGLEESAT